MANFKLALVQHKTAVLAVTEFDSYELLHEAAIGNGIHVSAPRISGEGAYQIDEIVPIPFVYMEGLPYNPDTTTMLNGELYITNNHNIIDSLPFLSGAAQ